MTRLILRKLKEGDEPALRAAIAEFKTTDPDWAFAFDLDANTRFDEYLALLAARERGERLNGFVPAIFMVATVGAKIVGRASIRHKLNDFLLREGGHIDYGVIPSERGKGYAKEMLRQALAYFGKLGVDRVLVTCDEDNVASCRVIESCGGIFENRIKTDAGKPLIKRYWIDLPQAPLRKPNRSPRDAGGASTEPGPAASPIMEK
jgi:predicted acetyltransferase